MRGAHTLLFRAGCSSCALRHRPLALVRGIGVMRSCTHAFVFVYLFCTFVSAMAWHTRTRPVFTWARYARPRFSQAVRLSGAMNWRKKKKKEL